MCDPEGSVCPEIDQWLQSIGFKPRWAPNDHLDIVLAIAECAARNSPSTTLKYTTYYPFTDIGWGGWKLQAVKNILRSDGWIFVEGGFHGKSGFYQPPALGPLDQKDRDGLVPKITGNYHL